MRIHCLQHVAFEGPAGIGQWAMSNGHTLTSTKFYEDEALPAVADIDWLVVMGGPMNIYEEEAYPWLVGEKAFIRAAIDGGKTVVGVCLGAQLIADVLGAKVYRGEHKEIGWFPVELTRSARESALFGFLPERFKVFHWHGDTFSLPEGAVHLARSEGCENQAFLYDGRVLALQFHLESTGQSVRDIVGNCGDEIVEARYVQNAGTILGAGPEDFGTIAGALRGILDRLAGR